MIYRRWSDDSVKIVHPTRRVDNAVLTNLRSVSRLHPLPRQARSIAIHVSASSNVNLDRYGLRAVNCCLRYFSLPV